MDSSIKKSDGDSGDSYTSVIYYHGMGDQKRFDEVSRLVNSIDEYQADEVDDKCKKNNFSCVDIFEEPSNQPDAKGDRHAYVYAKPEDSVADEDEIRFYEMYWAPLTAGHANAFEVLWWLISQGFNTVVTIFSPWRSKMRLRITVLFHYLEKQLNKNDSANEHEGNELDQAGKKLLKLYHRFNNDEIEHYPKGTFKEFKDYISNEDEKIKSLANNWYWYYFKKEGRNLLIITSILSVIFGLMIAMFKVGYVALVGVLNLLSKTEELNNYKLIYLIMVGVGLIVLIRLVFVALRYLREYMGDVQIWTTYEETAKKHKARKRILAESAKLVSHVLEDDQCKRVVIVAHSLGTTIAYDTLLKLGRSFRLNRNGDNLSPSKDSLKKIDVFITMGSPIDKVQYFFQSKQKSSRYNKIISNLRGDIGYIPFVKEVAGDPAALPDTDSRIDWVNFWYKGDIISGGLHSPNDQREGENKVTNYQADYPKGYWLNPVKSHTDYLECGNVRKMLYEKVLRKVKAG